MTGAFKTKLPPPLVFFFLFCVWYRAHFAFVTLNIAVDKIQAVYQNRRRQKKNVPLNITKATGRLHTHAMSFPPFLFLSAFLFLSVFFSFLHFLL